MIRSMTGFSKKEYRDNGITATVEIKSLNGRYLEIKCKLPRNHTHRELEVREIFKKYLTRGTVNVVVNIETEGGARPVIINEDAAIDTYNKLKKIKSKLQIKETVKFEHILHFSANFLEQENDENSEQEWQAIEKALREAIKSLNRMRGKEGSQISKDIIARAKNISAIVEKIEAMGIKRIPAERDKLRQKVAQLFESDEIDEQRIQLEIVLLADKLDISEECVRLKSHIKFFFEALKANEPVGKKMNFLLQEMNREINTIGSKANDADISQYVVTVKEELEKIREQIQNIE